MKNTMIPVQFGITAVIPAKASANNVLVNRENSLCLPDP